MQAAIVDRNPYVGDGTSPQLILSATAFVDILGYSDRIKRAFEAGTDVAELTALREALREARTFLNDSMNETGFDKRHLEVRAFSDNVVVGIPIRNHPISAFNDLVFYLSWFQMEMSRRGYFVRGAVSVGRLYIDDEVIFGPALLEAVDGERLADTPRIIFCNSAQRLLEKEAKDWGGYEPPHRFKGFVQDSDRNTFIDYLGESVMGNYEETGPASAILDQHKAVVEKALKDFGLIPKVRRKYEWVAAYHNYFCDLYPQFFDQSQRVDLRCAGQNFRTLREVFAPGYKPECG